MDNIGRCKRKRRSAAIIIIRSQFTVVNSLHGYVIMRISLLATLVPALLLNKHNTSLQQGRQFKEFQSWTHLNQSLAHPMGCNFIEWVSFIRYQKKEWTFLEQFSWAAFGRDRDVNNDGIIDNLGGNILRSYKDPFEQYGHSILQGDKSNFFYHAFTVSRALPKFESFEIFLNHTLRYDQNETRRNLDHFIMVGVRVIGLLQMATDY